MGQIFQRFNLRSQMYIVAGLCALSHLAIIAYVWSAEPDLTLVDVAVGITVFQLFSSMVVFGFAHIMGTLNGQRAEIILQAMGALAKGDLTKKINMAGKDEFAWMCWEYTCARKGFTEVIKNIISGSTHLAAASEELSAITSQGSSGIVRQQSEIQQVATAMEEMSATVNEVAKNAVNAATAAQEADDQSKHGFTVVNDTVETIHSLADEVKRTAEVVEKLKEDCLKIGTVLDVIRDIAEQTNLLALNAAIEAARAGEHGRGFAVVADEVRTLASRTQQSTQEINGMIERLQAGANQAVIAMEKGREKANDSVEQSVKAGEALEAITTVVDRIKSMTMQIASAAEQQSTTTEEVNRSIVSISDVAEDAALGAQKTANSSDDLAKLAVELQEQVSQFKISS